MSKIMKGVSQRTDLDRAVEIVRDNAQYAMFTHQEAARLVEKGIALGRILGPGGEAYSITKQAMHLWWRRMKS